jgi:hypothetical protein
MKKAPSPLTDEEFNALDAEARRILESGPASEHRPGLMLAPHRHGSAKASPICVVLWNVVRAILT